MAPAAGLLKQQGLEVEGHDVKYSPPWTAICVRWGLNVIPQS